MLKLMLKALGGYLLTVVAIVVSMLVDVLAALADLANALLAEVEAFAGDDCRPAPPAAEVATRKAAGWWQRVERYYDVYMDHCDPDPNDTLDALDAMALYHLWDRLKALVLRQREGLASYRRRQRMWRRFAESLPAVRDLVENTTQLRYGEYVVTIFHPRVEEIQASQQQAGVPALPERAKVSLEAVKGWAEL